MKKYMVADLVKDLKEDQINYLLINYNITRSDAKYIVDNYRNQYEQRSIARSMDEYGFNLRNAEEFVDNFPNESTWPDVEDTADLYGVEILDVNDDMVEAYLSFNEDEKVYLMENGGWKEAKGSIDTSMGKVLWWFNIALGTFILTVLFKNGNPAQYPISVSELKQIRSSGSFGGFFNNKIKGNSMYSDKEGSCGCIGEDPENPKRLCDSEDFAQMPQEFKRYL
jgi:hypothetical protein